MLFYQNKMIMTIGKYLIISCLCCLCSFANGQRQYHSAIGVRLGTPQGVTYKQFLNNTDAMELALGRNSKDNYSVTNFSIGYQIHETDVDEFINWYYGAGAGVYFFAYDSAYNSSKDGSISLGINGSLGVDYKFDALPINLGVEWTPTFNFGNVAQKGLRLGCFGFVARYVLTED